MVQGLLISDPLTLYVTATSFIYKETLLPALQLHSGFQTLRELLKKQTLDFENLKQLSPGGNFHCNCGSAFRAIHIECLNSTVKSSIAQNKTCGCL